MISEGDTHTTSHPVVNTHLCLLTLKFYLPNQQPIDFLGVNSMFPIRDIAQYEHCRPFPKWGNHTGAAVVLVDLQFPLQNKIFAARSQRFYNSLSR